MFYEKDVICVDDWCHGTCSISSRHATNFTSSIRKKKAFLKGLFVLFNGITVNH